MFRIARRHFTSEFVSVVAEMGSLLVVFWIAGHLATVIRGPSFAPSPGELWISALIFVTVLVLYLYLNGLYHFHERLAATALWIKFFRALALSAFSLWLIYFLFPGFQMARSALLPALALSVLILVPWRHLAMAHVRQRPSFYRVAKRVMDLFVAGVGIVVAAPVFAVIAVAVKLDTPGPVFFRQTRVGLNRRPFRMWKFRKMPVDLPTQGPMVTTRYDYRLTRVGRVLERLKFDELPQLFDVLRGTMSVVGPRPEVPKFVAHYPELWDQVLTVKPGIFGASQLQFRNESEMYPGCGIDPEQYYVTDILPAKLLIDAEYAREASIGRDLWLLVKGVALSLFGAITWQTVVVRRAQLASFVILSALGIGGMAGAHMVVGTPLSTPGARTALLFAALAKPLALLGLRVPKALATSMTPDDYRRLVWACLGSSTAILLAAAAQSGARVDYAVLMLDGMFFLAALLVYKLFLYTFYVSIVLHQSWVVARHVFLVGVLFGPLSIGVALSLTYGGDAWSQGLRLRSVILVGAALLVRPAMLLLLRPMRSKESYTAWLRHDALLVVAASGVGSSLLMVTPLVFGQPVLPISVVAWDAAVFTALALLAAVPRGTSGSHHASDASDATTQSRLLIVGSGVELPSYVASLDSIRDEQYELIGLVTPERSHRASSIGGHPVVGSLGDLSEILESVAVDVVMVLDSSLREDERAAVEECAGARGVPRFHIRLLPDWRAFKTEHGHQHDAPHLVVGLAGSHDG
jgi:lipopolysaccharide/colanic/teichoic acid biosynthesis glycosyltransferase